jgi:hypothetical protein
MLGAPARLRKYADGLASGLLTVLEVAAVLDLLAECSARAATGAGAPASLRGEVLAYLAEVSLNRAAPGVLPRPVGHGVACRPVARGRGRVAPPVPSC